MEIFIGLSLENTCIMQSVSEEIALVCSPLLPMSWSIVINNNQMQQEVSVTTIIELGNKSSAFKVITYKRSSFLNLSAMQVLSVNSEINHHLHIVGYSVFPSSLSSTAF